MWSRLTNCTAERFTRCTRWAQGHHVVNASPMNMQAWQIYCWGFVRVPVYLISLGFFWEVVYLWSSFCKELCSFLICFSLTALWTFCTSDPFPAAVMQKNVRHQNVFLLVIGKENLSAFANWLRTWCLSEELSELRSDCTVCAVMKSLIGGFKSMSAPDVC